jgi:threonine synthase
MKVDVRCSLCNRFFNASERLWRCTCGGFLTLEFQPQFPLEKIQKRTPTMWRYREALPILHDDHIVSFNEGFTPLVNDEFFGRTVLVKQDYLFPSGSFKDRGASVLISKINELGIKKVIEDSSGNAGAAIAGYCAKAHIDCHIYVPQHTSARKLTQIHRYGAHLHTIQGSRQDTAGAAFKQAQTTYYASHYWNPYFFHGTKTCIFEIVEQLGWNIPETIFVPVGNGTLLYGIFIGLQELRTGGIIDTYPRIIAVQAKNCSPLAVAWKTQADIPDYKMVEDTHAEGIAITTPPRAKEILHSIKETNGDVITVSEKEILDALEYTQRKGYYIEPTSAVVVAAFKKYRLRKDQVVVLPLTGHGLKQR